MRRDDEGIKEVFEQSFFPASEEQMETGCEHVWRRLRFLPNVEGGRAAAQAPHADRTWRISILVPVMAFTVLVLLVVPLIRGVIWPKNVYAKVLDGSVELLNGGNTLRTNSDTGALVALSDSSRIEMRTESELSLERAADGIRIRLKKGNVIVEAAQGKEHLYLQTKDFTVTAGGSVFLVNAMANGSHIAIIDGEARLDCGNVEQTLRPGQRVATTPGMPPLDIDQEVAWSRTAKLRLAMLQRSLTGAIVTGGSVAGVVRASDGRPASNVPVTALRADTITTIRAILSLTATDSEGRYRLESVPPGSFYITAGRLDGPTYYPGTLEIEDAQIVSVAVAAAVTGMDFIFQDASIAAPSPLVPKSSTSPVFPLTEEQQARVGAVMKQLGDKEQDPAEKEKVKKMLQAIRKAYPAQPVVPPAEARDSSTKK